MASIIYFVRTSKKTNPTKKISVRIRFRDGKKVNLYAKTGLELLPNHFSNDTHTINKHARYKDKNKDKQYLDNLEATILEAYKELKEPPTSNWLNLVVDKYRFPEKYEKKNDVPTLFEFIAQYIKEAPFTPRRSNDRLPSKKTLVDYNVTFTNLKEFAEFKGKNDFRFDEINTIFYNDFKKYLTIKKGYALNTVGKKIKVLKTFLNEAEYRGYIDKSAYRHFKKLSEPKKAIYLSVEELEKIESLQLPEVLDKVRDLFLIGCWTGLRFSDWHKVAKENIENGLINLNQQKTGQPVIIPIHPTVEAILNKYEGNLPKSFSNQKFNEYIKQVAKLAAFKEAITIQITKGGKTETTVKPKWQLVTTHTARRSFATNMYKMGIPSITIMAITGHRTETAFLKYIKVTPQEHAEKMREMWLNKGSHLKVAK